jgi:DNA repair protein RadC
LRAKFLGAGPDALADYELLELLLFPAILRKDTKPLAKALLKRFDNSFANVINAEAAELKAVKGVSEPVLVALKSVQAAVQIVLRQQIIDQPVLSNWNRVLDFCASKLAHEKVEEFHLLFLDRKNVLIKHEPQQRGTVDHTPVYTREVVKRALELSASSIIMVHNHPSGDPTPSRADIEMTREIAKAAAPLGIQVHDHVIIGRGRHTSLKSMGLF